MPGATLRPNPEHSFTSCRTLCPPNPLMKSIIVHSRNRRFPREHRPWFQRAGLVRNLLEATRRPSVVTGSVRGGLEWAAIEWFARRFGPTWEVRPPPGWPHVFGPRQLLPMPAGRRSTCDRVAREESWPDLGHLQTAPTLSASPPARRNKRFPADGRPQKIETRGSAGRPSKEKERLAWVYPRRTGA